jgi:hypothetical protein
LIAADVRPSWVPVIVLTLPAFILAPLQSALPNPSLADTTISFYVLASSKMLFYYLVVSPFLLALVGRWLGGHADAGLIRQVVAWSMVPVAVASAFWIPIVLLVGRRVLTEALTGPLPAVTDFAAAVCGAWSDVVYVGMLAEVQRFSLGRAIISLIVQYLGMLVSWAATIQIERFVGLR